MIVQGTPEWFQERLGKITASRIFDIMEKTTGGKPKAGRKNYIAQLVCERLTGEREETFKSPAMKWGTETEPMARTHYEVEAGSIVQEVGFINHPNMPYSGASPDGLVNKDGMIEIKCPNTATHINTLRTGKIDSKYMYQMVWQMECTGRDWCDFVSFDPRLPYNCRMFVKRVYMTVDIELIKNQVISANAEIEEIAKELKEYKGD